MNVADKDAAFGAEFFQAGGEVSQKPFCFRGILDGVGANVDDGCPRLDPVRLHEACFAHGGNENIGAADHLGQIARFGMTNGDGGVGVHEEEGHGLADDVAAAEYDGVGTLDRNVAAAEDFHAAGRSAGDQAGTSADKAAETDGMKTVHVLGGIDGFEDALGVDVCGEGKLDEDAVDLVVAIQAIDEGEHFFGGDSCPGRTQEAGEAELFASSNLALDVKLRSGVFADEDRGETGANACGGERADFALQFSKDSLTNFQAIEDARGHVLFAFTKREQIITHAKFVTGGRRKRDKR